MQLLKEYIKKTLAHRHMGHQMIGAVALNTVRTFLQNLKFPSFEDKEIGNSKFENVEGYVRFKVLFLKTSDQALKIQIFKQKNQIIHEVNLALEKVGYRTRVNELRLN